MKKTACLILILFATAGILYIGNLYSNENLRVFVRTYSFKTNSSDFLQACAKEIRASGTVSADAARVTTSDAEFLLTETGGKYVCITRHSMNKLINIELFGGYDTASLKSDRVFLGQNIGSHHSCLDSYPQQLFEDIISTNENVKNVARYYIKAFEESNSKIDSSAYYAASRQICPASVKTHITVSGITMEKWSPAP